jgi:predicted small metal-binding protein
VPLEKEKTMARQINCDDGFVISGNSDDELVTNAYAHMKEHHPDLYSTLSREQILGLVVEV